MVPDKEILSIAGGRIWSGEKAVQLGLVDKIGDLDDAIESAKIIDSNYKFIDLNKKINTAIYCFECEYISSQ